MASHVRPSSIKPMGEMNLTSMMDLTFLLLITFIITFPLIEQGLPVNLPKANAQHIDTKEHSVSVTIAADETVHFEEDAVSLDDLAARLRARMSTDPETFVFVRGDESVRYGRIVEVLKLVHGLGITRLTLVTQEAH